MSQSRRKFLATIGAVVVAYGIGDRFAPLARKVGKHTALAMPYRPRCAKDAPLIHYCLPGEWARIKATGYDMHDCILRGQIPVSGKERLA